jgi:hypothetical protein
MRSRVLHVGLCFRDSLFIIEKEFGVGELFELFDLQVPVFVRGDLYNVDRFAAHVHPD